jgi:cell division protein FtsX
VSWIDLPFLAFGSFLALTAWHAARTGAIQSRFRVLRREAEPEAFQVNLMLRVLAAGVFLAIALLNVPGALIAHG